MRRPMGGVQFKTDTVGLRNGLRSTHSSASATGELRRIGPVMYAVKLNYWGCIEAAKFAIYHIE